MTAIRKLFMKPAKRISGYLSYRMPFEVHLRRPKPEWDGENDRFSYQRKHVAFDIQPGQKVLDIGSGGDSFPFATLLAERYFEPTRHRSTPFKADGRPIVICDIHRLPFKNRAFDYVYCSHVLEHVYSPIEARQELMRVGESGYIETPTFGKDALFAWAKGMHKWHLVSASPNLCFFEYTPRQLEGIRSPTWRDIILGRWYHPLQKAFYDNQDLFNVMFSWSDSFGVFVFRLDGSVETLNAVTRDRQGLKPERFN